MQLTDGVHRLGSRYANFYAIEDEGAVTILDTGVPGYWNQVPSLMKSLGRSMSDIVAIVQTHSHSDHIGSSERLRAETGASVFIHELEGPILRGDAKPKKPQGMGSLLLSPTAFKILGHFARNGGNKFPTVEKVETFRGGDVLDVPGRPRVLFTPGHSPGHCAVLLESRSVLFSGDAIVTLDLHGRTGPRLMDINEDPDGARRALDDFAGAEADLLLPGHGEPWTDGVAEAVAHARRV